MESDSNGIASTFARLNQLPAPSSIGNVFASLPAPPTRVVRISAGFAQLLAPGAPAASQIIDGFAQLLNLDKTTSSPETPLHEQTLSQRQKKAASIWAGHHAATCTDEATRKRYMQMVRAHVGQNPDKQTLECTPLLIHTRW